LEKNNLTRSLTEFFQLEEGHSLTNNKKFEPITMGIRDTS